METTTTKTKKVARAPKAERSLKADVYAATGKKSGSLELPESMFSVPWNDSLIHQVVTSMLSNARTPVAHAKTRGEVRGGGKKPWRQKGTGRSRHGSSRSPIWKGGGVTHGPRNDKNYSKRIPKKMRAKALYMALSKKFSDGELVLVNGLSFAEPKTAAAKKALDLLSVEAGKGLSSKKKNGALIAFSDPKETAYKSFRNIGSVECEAVRNLNAVDVLKHKYLIIEDPEAAIAILASRMNKDSAAVSAK